MITWFYEMIFNRLLHKRLGKACMSAQTMIPLPNGASASHDHPNLVVMRELLQYWQRQGREIFLEKGRLYQQVFYINFVAIASLLCMKVTSVSLEIIGGLSGLIIGVAICLIIASLIDEDLTMFRAQDKQNLAKQQKCEMLTTCTQLAVFQIGLVVAIGFPAGNAISIPFLLGLPLGILWQALTLPIFVDRTAEQKLSGDQMRRFILMTGDLLTESSLEEILTTEMEGGRLTAADFFKLQQNTTEFPINPVQSGN